MKKTPETKLQYHGDLNRLTLSEYTSTYLDRLNPSVSTLPQEDTEFFLGTFAFLFSPHPITLNILPWCFQQSEGGTFLVFFLALWFQSHSSLNITSCRNIILPTACYEPVTGSFLRFLFLLIFFLFLPWLITVVWLHVCVWRVCVHRPKYCLAKTAYAVTVASKARHFLFFLACPGGFLSLTFKFSSLGVCLHKRTNTYISFRCLCAIFSWYW